MHRSLVLASIGLSLGASCADIAAQAPLLSRFTRPVWTSSQSFTTIVAVRELPDGRVLLTDVDEHQLYLLDRSGQNAAQVGRVGSGPGEYGSPTVLLPMPGDSTLLLDRDARRFLMLDPSGRLASTSPFPPELTAMAPHLRGADLKGRLYFQAKPMSDRPDGVVSLLRWDRQAGRIESVATVRLPAPRPVSLPSGASMRRIMPYSPSDDWGIAPSGRVILVRADPYRIEWVAPDGSVGRGAIMPARPVPVTDADKRANEPKGPPFRLEYPKAKPAIVAGHTVIDPEGRAVVCRSRAAGAPSSQWDVFDPSGRLLGTQQLPSNRKIVAVSRRLVYVVKTDADDLQWLEAYAR